VAVAVHAGEHQGSRGEASWHPVLEGALNLLGLTHEKSIRLVVGKHTVVVQTEGDETVAVVLPTGHAIAKSLRRMIRRMAKKDRGPLREVARPVPSHGHVPSAPVPSPSWGS
jgi:hypothetical protein